MCRVASRDQLSLFGNAGPDPAGPEAVVTAAQRALAQARTADISAQTQVLTTLADLAYRTGDLLHTTSKPGKP